MNKQIITAVVAMNFDRVIGTNNQLPWHIPEDLKYFKQVTLNKPIIMGRKTFESIGRALPNRRNIVITRGDFSAENIEIFSSIDDALKAVKNEPEICIIGGGEIFKQTISIVNSLHITEVLMSVDNPCAWFPEIDYGAWSLITQDKILSNSGVECVFKHYLRKSS